MMPMKKITFNALLNHKAHNYKPSGEFLKN